MRCWGLRPAWPLLDHARFCVGGPAPSSQALLSTAPCLCRLLSPSPIAHSASCKAGQADMGATGQSLPCNVRQSGREACGSTAARARSVTEAQRSGGSEPNAVWAPWPASALPAHSHSQHAPPASLNQRRLGSAALACSSPASRPRLKLASASNSTQVSPGGRPGLPCSPLAARRRRPRLAARRSPLTLRPLASTPPGARSAAHAPWPSGSTHGAA